MQEWGDESKEERRKLEVYNFAILCAVDADAEETKEDAEEYS